MLPISIPRRARTRYWLTPDEIAMYGISDHPQRMERYLSFRAWSRVVRVPLNENRWRDLLDNKWVFGKVFGDMGFPVPEHYGLLDPTWGSFEDGGVFRSIDDLTGWLERTKVRAFVLKPVLGWASKGIVVVDAAVNSGTDRAGWAFKLADGTTASPDGLRGMLELGFRGMPGYVLQQRLVPHPWVQELSGGGPGGFRVVTLRGRDGTITPLFAIMRSGSPGQMCETFATGSMTIPADLSTGALGLGRSSADLCERAFDRHPASGRSFEGMVVPEWRAVLDLVSDAARRQPGLACVCWDVYLSADGPVLLEGNVGFQIQTFQIHSEGFLADGTARRWAELGSDLPDGSRAWVRRHSPSLPRQLLRRIRGITQLLPGPSGRRPR